ncbi:MAG: MarR family winged helix-turn-helix transcriptional regulator [Acidimicrobiia bacterium]
MSRPTRDELAAWRAFLEAHHGVMSRLTEELEEVGLPIGFYDVLIHLTEEGPDGLRMADLARRVLVSRSGLTRLVDRMEQDGLVRRRPSPEDGRGYYVTATPQGKTALCNASPTHLRGIAAHFTSQLTHGEIAVISEALSRVAKAAVHVKS